MSLYHFLVLVLLGIVWGASFFLIKIGVEDIPPFTFVTGRVAIAAIVLNGVLFLRGLHLPSLGRSWIPFLIMGILNGAVPYTLITWGEVYIDSGLAAILNASMPLFTVLLAHFMTQDERLGPYKILGISFGLAGVVILLGPEALSGLGHNFLAQMAVLVASLSYALAAIYGRRLRGRSPLILAAGQLTAATFIMLPLSIIVDRPAELTVGWPAFGAMVALALFGTAFAYLLYYWLLERIGATNLSLVTYLLPISGVIWGALILAERLHWSAFVSMAMILGGVAFVNRRRRVTPIIVPTPTRM